jgi:hypothetical protein
MLAPVRRFRGDEAVHRSEDDSASASRANAEVFADHRVRVSGFAQRQSLAFLFALLDHFRAGPAILGAHAAGVRRFLRGLLLLRGMVGRRSGRIRTFGSFALHAAALQFRPLICISR